MSSSLVCGASCMGYVCHLPWNHDGLHEGFGVGSAMGWPDHWSDSPRRQVVGVL